MPIYEYECSSCRTRFERKQRFDDEPISICPSCQGRARRLIQAVPIVFKGSGFYVTDNRQNSHASSEPVSEKQDSQKQDSQKEEHKKEEAAVKGSAS